MNRELEMAKLACRALDEKKGKDMSKIQSGCSDDCLSCGVSGCCGHSFYGASDSAAQTRKEEG